MVALIHRATEAPALSGPAALQWLTVSSNLDPRAGGVSAIMSPLIRSVTATGRVRMSLAAFCNPDDELTAITSAVEHSERHALGGLRSLLPSQANIALERQIRDAAGVHIHGIWQEHCALTARYARLLRKPYIVSAHGMLDPWALRSKSWKKKLYMSLVEKRNLQGAACLHALTASEAKSYRQFAPGVPVAIIPNGAEVPDCADPEIFLARFPALRGKHLVLFLARIHYKKGLDILCQAWRNVGARWPDAHLVLAGPDSENSRASLEQVVKSLGIEDRVTFTGMLAGTEKWSALAASELFVLPSYSEGLSVSVLEAMGVGRPVLITEQCHIDGIVENSCGWQIQPRASDIEAALHEFFALPISETGPMGKRGQAFVKQAYAWKSVGRQMASVYEWVSGGPRPADVEIIQT